VLPVRANPKATGSEPETANASRAVGGALARLAVVIVQLLGDALSNDRKARQARRRVESESRPIEAPNAESPDG
jgi:hypothetical protein